MCCILKTVPYIGEGEDLPSLISPLLDSVLPIASTCLYVCVYIYYMFVCMCVCVCVCVYICLKLVHYPYCTATSHYTRTKAAEAAVNSDACIDRGARGSPSLSGGRNVLRVLCGYPFFAWVRFAAAVLQVFWPLTLDGPRSDYYYDTCSDSSYEVIDGWRSRAPRLWQ